MEKLKEEMAPMNTELGPLPTENTATKGPELKTIGFYRQALVPHLSPQIFATNPARLGWYVFCGLGALACFFAIATLPLTWPVKLLWGLGLGFCNGTMAFVCHELYHGAIVKSQKVQDFLGFFGAVPFFVSPTFWRFWHNRLHHGSTQQLIRDPDAFPNMRIYKSSKFARFMFPFTPGSGHKRSYAYLLFWFSFHNFVAQTYLRFRNSIFDTLDQRRVTLEFVGQIIIGGAALAYAGPSNWLYVLVIPLFVQNYILMSYISTNHNLNPLTPVNDPLVNSLTVTNNPVFEYLSLNFGYHVEHHIFPAMSSKHAKVVHQQLLRQFPLEYKAMPKSRALRLLYQSPRIYKNAHQLINPETQQTFPTI